LLADKYTALPKVKNSLETINDASTGTDSAVLTAKELHLI
jgi:hypothetical protein